MLMILPGCIEIEEDEHQFHGDNISPPMPFREFTLVDGTDGGFNSSDAEGQVFVIAFLFTNCPDICPIISSNLNWLQEQLGHHVGENVTILSITVDPWRDTPEVMQYYSDDRNLDWPHLTVNDTDSDLPDIESIWEDFEVGIQVVENGTDNGTSGRHHPGYDVDHSTGTVIVDRNGMQRVWWADYDWMPELVLEDVEYLINE